MQIHFSIPMFLALAIFLFPACDDKKKDIDPVCGDGILEDDEPCDGELLGGASCQMGGFLSGTLTCRADCTFDTSDCSMTCGDGVADEYDVCDGTDLRGTTCIDMGYRGGTLACTSDCTYDETPCIPAPCGDGEALDGEHCDGADLRGQTCADRGFFGGGTLACHTDCTYDIEACVLGGPEEYTNSYPCEVGRPCNPLVLPGPDLPQICLAIDPVQGPQCELACERHEDCPAGLACLETEGYSYCGPQTCEIPFSTCTLATGLPGLCIPEGEATLGQQYCRLSGARALGEVCNVDRYREIFHEYPLFAFQYDFEAACVSGVCSELEDSPTTGLGVCAELVCDALSVIDGALPDPCPTGWNCWNQSRVGSGNHGYGSWMRSVDVGVCITMDLEAPGRLLCHVLTQLTHAGEACPVGTACGPDMMSGSLQGLCREVSATPLEPGAACTTDAECSAGFACIPGDPFTYPEVFEAPYACRAICDARTFADNPACAGLPADTTWVCLTVSRFFTLDHELPEVHEGELNYVETSPSPLGFCVPDRL